MTLKQRVEALGCELSGGLVFYRGVKVAGRGGRLLSSYVRRLEGSARLELAKRVVLSLESLGFEPDDGSLVRGDQRVWLSSDTLLTSGFYTPMTVRRAAELLVFLER